MESNNSRARGWSWLGAVSSRYSFTLIAVLSLLWLVLRSGRKPSRLNYPCQRAALANSSILFAGAAVPVAARMPRALASGKSARRLASIAQLVCVAALVALLVTSIPSRGQGGIPGGRGLDRIKLASAGLFLPELSSSAADASRIYVAEGIPRQSEKGVDSLIDVMDANGLDFFQSNKAGGSAGPGGIIGSNDVVVIKVNGEWRDRGGTNTDVVRGIVDAIVNHPDSFTGEVVICDNGHWDTVMDNRPDNRNPDRCNAEDRGQSFNDVAMMYAGRHRVSVYDWTFLQKSVVGEYSQGDGRDGYVYAPDQQVGYPKFTTVYGTRISLRIGVWDGARYDNARLKLLNVPVLKSHSGMGVTAAVKHFMGVQDRWRNTEDPPHQPVLTEGFMGRMMLLARYPDLNIVDAIWACPGASGPEAPYNASVRLDRLLASRDPIALDYYCGKYVLLPVSGWQRHDPNNTNGENPGAGRRFSDGTPCNGYAYNTFHQMLTSTYGVLLGAGKQVTMDESRMEVCKTVAPQEPPPANHEYFLAEGCTGYGFETWVLVANPNDLAATVTLSYYTEKGPRNSEPVTVPARSRLTVNASSVIWRQSAGIRVGSDLPVYVERSMYWGGRAEGHDSIGTEAPSTDWYLAEGCTDHGIETWVEILNPGTADATANVTYVTPTGPVAGPTLVVPARSRRDVSVNGTAPRGDVSTRVTADNPVVVERSVYWDGRRGGSGSIGARQSSTDWYLAEGATHSGFQTYVLLFNPGDTAADVTLRFATAPPLGAGETEKRVSVPAMSRKTVDLNAEVPGVDVSTGVHSDAPVVAERSMYWQAAGGRAGHDSIGMTAPAKEIFLPEGCTAHGFDTWLLVQNPGATRAEVLVFAMKDGGEEKVCSFELVSRARRSVRLNDFYNGDLSIRVEATEPVVAERSIYWAGREGGTCSIGYQR